jgi:hypothetical protein
MWVCTLPLIEEQANQSPLAAFLQHQDLMSSESRVTTGPSQIRFGRPFAATLVASPAVHLRSHELANADTSQATLLTIANAVVTRRRAEVCTLPLGLAGGPRASRSPSSCTGLP